MGIEMRLARIKAKIIVTSVFEFGGNNTYLKTVAKYFDNSRLHFVVNNNEDLRNFAKLQLNEVNKTVRIVHGLHQVARFGNLSFIRRSSELFIIVRSLIKIVMTC